MKNYILVLACLVFVVGCSFSRQFSVIATGVDAQQYGNVDKVLLQSNIVVEAFK